MAKVITLTLSGKTFEFADKDAETLVTVIRKAAAGANSHAIVTGGRLECLVSKLGNAQQFKADDSDDSPADDNLTDY